MLVTKSSRIVSNRQTIVVGCPDCSTNRDLRFSPLAVHLETVDGQVGPNTPLRVTDRGRYLIARGEQEGGMDAHPERIVRRASE
jgi:hypothetical protein